MSKSVKTVGQSIKKSVESLLPRGVDIVTVALVIAVIALLYVLSDSNKKIIEGQKNNGITDLKDLRPKKVNVFKKDDCFAKNSGNPTPMEDPSKCKGNKIFVAEGQYCTDSFCRGKNSGYECDDDSNFKFKKKLYYPCDKTITEDDDDDDESDSGEEV